MVLYSIYHGLQALISDAAQLVYLITHIYIYITYKQYNIFPLLNFSIILSDAMFTALDSPCPINNNIRETNFLYVIVI